MEILHNINMERSVLSSIFFNPSLFEEVAASIKSNAFYLPSHKNIFEAMQWCERENLPIDEEFVSKKLNQDNNFDEEAMLEIQSTSPLPSINAYVDELREKHVKREFVKLSSDINDFAVDKDLPVKEVVDLVQQKLFSITQENTTKDFKDSPSMVSSTMEHIKKMKDTGNLGIVGLDTGYKDLNNLTSGFGDGDLIIVAARPAMGKTSFCLNIAQKVLDNNKGVAIFSLEMPSEQLMLRMLSTKTSIPLQKLRVGDLNDEQWSDLSYACEQMSGKDFFVDDNQNVDIHQVRAKLRKLKMNHPSISVCVIDYLQLMDGSGKKDRHLEVSEISRGLKLLARELEIPIIALSQLNRSLESRGDKRPMLSDLRESGSIEQDADMILFVYRDDVYKEREEREREKKAQNENKEYKSNFFSKPEEEAEIIVGKNRNGPIGTAKLVFQKAFTRFVSNSGISIQYTSKDGTQTQLNNIDIPTL